MNEHKWTPALQFRCVSNTRKWTAYITTITDGSLTPGTGQECADRANAAPKLLEQRDELANALEKIVGTQMPDCQRPYGPNAEYIWVSTCAEGAIDNARAALAKIKENQE